MCTDQRSWTFIPRILIHIFRRVDKVVLNSSTMWNFWLSGLTVRISARFAGCYIEPTQARDMHGHVVRTLRYRCFRGCLKNQLVLCRVTRVSSCQGFVGEFVIVNEADVIDSLFQTVIADPDSWFRGEANS